LETQFKSTHPNHTVERLANTEQETKKDENKLYYQIASINEYFEPSEGSLRITHFENKFNLNKFIFEVPFTTSGGVQTEDFEQQCKKKIIYTVESSFPCLRKRLQVIKKEEIILSPIENAIDNISSKVKEYQKEILSQPPNSKRLQLVIQGSLLTQVIYFFLYFNFLIFSI
jgi:dedicator of cytokinesis protein 6/7/8